MLCRPAARACARYVSRLGTRIQRRAQTVRSAGDAVSRQPFFVAALSALLALPSAGLQAQTTGDACGAMARPRWSPERPRPGTLFAVTVADLPVGVTPQGVVAGERLHFAADSTGGWRALAAVPIDSGDSLGLVLACGAAPTDSARHVIPLATATYPLERLTVAPRFSAPPDSALVARQRREAERAAQVSTASHETPRLWSDPFRAPRSTRITSSFGRGRQFNGKVTSRHMGTDYAGAVGTPIRAANRGVVRLVDSFYLGGNVVYIDHGEGLVTAYLHLSQHRVAQGDTVEQGALIGLVGATGRVTGPHLHWIARYGRVTVDPISLLEVTSPPPAVKGPAEGTDQEW